MKGAYIRMHFAIFLWGFTGLLGKLINLTEGPLVWYRMLISSLILAVFLWYKKEWPRMKTRELIRIGSIGIIVMLHWVTFYGSIKMANISVAMICLSAIAMFSSVLEPLVNRKPFDFLEILFSILAMVGISTIYMSDSSASAGVIIGVISAFLSALFSVLNRRIASMYEPLTISFIELSSGWLFLSLLLPVYFIIHPASSLDASSTDWFYLLILSFFCTVLTWILSLQALRKVSAFTMALALNLEPVYGIILAVLFAGEMNVINQWFILGAVIILLTVVLHAIYRFKKNHISAA